MKSFAEYMCEFAAHQRAAEDILKIMVKEAVELNKKIKSMEEEAKASLVTPKKEEKKD
jgi:hypothetical protein